MGSTRRKFLQWTAGGAALTGLAGSWWISISERRTARWLRTIAKDSQRDVLAAPVKPDLNGWKSNSITVSWIGHATVLIDFYGFKILTDPAFGSRVGVWLGVTTAGPKRYIAPALTIKELPKIDLLLLSHAHMDHMDIPSLRKLRDTPTTITSKLTSEILSKTRLKNIRELGWGDKIRVRAKVGDLEVEAFEVRHWGRRWPNDIERGYNGYILRRENRSILFAGDTAMTPLLGRLHPYGPFEFSVMPIGAYRPWIRSHCSPEEAVEMANAAGARYLIPVHHQTFKLSDEPMTEPIERLTEALAGEPERLAISEVGGTFSVA